MAEKKEKERPLPKGAWDFWPPPDGWKIRKLGPRFYYSNHDAVKAKLPYKGEYYVLKDAFAAMYMHQRAEFDAYVKRHDLLKFKEVREGIDTANGKQQWYEEKQKDPNRVIKKRRTPAEVAADKAREEQEGGKKKKKENEKRIPKEKSRRFNFEWVTWPPGWKYESLVPGSGKQKMFQGPIDPKTGKPKFKPTPVSYDCFAYMLQHDRQMAEKFFDDLPGCRGSGELELAYKIFEGKEPTYFEHQRSKHGKNKAEGGKKENKATEKKQRKESEKKAAASKAGAAGVAASSSKNSSAAASKSDSSSSSSGSSSSGSDSDSSDSSSSDKNAAKAAKSSASSSSKGGIALKGKPGTTVSGRPGDGKGHTLIKGKGALPLDPRLAAQRGGPRSPVSPDNADPRRRGFWNEPESDLEQEVFDDFDPMLDADADDFYLFANGQYAEQRQKRRMRDTYASLLKARDVDLPTQATAGLQRLFERRAEQRRHPGTAYEAGKPLQQEVVDAAIKDDEAILEHLRNNEIKPESRTPKPNEQKGLAQQPTVGKPQIDELFPETLEIVATDESGAGKKATPKKTTVVRHYNVTTNGTKLDRSKIAEQVATLRRGRGNQEIVKSTANVSGGENKLTIEVARNWPVGTKPDWFHGLPEFDEVPDAERLRVAFREKLGRATAGEGRKGGGRSPIFGEEKLRFSRKAAEPAGPTRPSAAGAAFAQAAQQKAPNLNGSKSAAPTNKQPAHNPRKKPLTTPQFPTTPGRPTRLDFGANPNLSVSAVADSGCFAPFADLLDESCFEPFADLGYESDDNDVLENVLDEVAESALDLQDELLAVEDGSFSKKQHRALVAAEKKGTVSRGGSGGGGGGSAGKILRTDKGARDKGGSSAHAAKEASTKSGTLPRSTSKARGGSAGSGKGAPSATGTAIGGGPATATVGGMALVAYSQKGQKGVPSFGMMKPKQLATKVKLDKEAAIDAFDRKKLLALRQAAITNQKPGANAAKPPSTLAAPPRLALASGHKITSGRVLTAPFFSAFQKEVQKLRERKTKTTTPSPDDKRSNKQTLLWRRWMAERLGMKTDESGALIRHDGKRVPAVFQQHSFGRSSVLVPAGSPDLAGSGSAFDPDLLFLQQTLASRQLHDDKLFREFQNARFHEFQNFVIAKKLVFHTVAQLSRLRLRGGEREGRREMKLLQKRQLRTAREAYRRRLAGAKRRAFQRCFQEGKASPLERKNAELAAVRSVKAKTRRPDARTTGGSGVMWRLHLKGKFSGLVAKSMDKSRRSQVGQRAVGKSSSIAAGKGGKQPPRQSPPAATSSSAVGNKPSSRVLRRRRRPPGECSSGSKLLRIIDELVRRVLALDANENRTPDLREGRTPFATPETVPETEVTAYVEKVVAKYSRKAKKNPFLFSDTKLFENDSDSTEFYDSGDDVGPTSRPNKGQEALKFRLTKLREIKELDRNGRLVLERKEQRNLDHRQELVHTEWLEPKIVENKLEDELAFVKDQSGKVRKDSAALLRDRVLDEHYKELLQNSKNPGGILKAQLQPGDQIVEKEWAADQDQFVAKTASRRLEPATRRLTEGILVDWHFPLMQELWGVDWGSMWDYIDQGGKATVLKTGARAATDGRTKTGKSNVSQGASSGTTSCQTAAEQGADETFTPLLALQDRTPVPEPLLPDEMEADLRSNEKQASKRVLSKLKLRKGHEIAESLRERATRRATPAAQRVRAASVVASGAARMETSQAAGKASTLTTTAAPAAPGAAKSTAATTTLGSKDSMPSSKINPVADDSARNYIAAADQRIAAAQWEQPSLQSILRDRLGVDLSFRDEFFDSFSASPNDTYDLRKNARNAKIASLLQLLDDEGPRADEKNQNLQDPHPSQLAWIDLLLPHWTHGDIEELEKLSGVEKKEIKEDGHVKDVYFGTYPGSLKARQSWRTARVYLVRKRKETNSPEQIEKARQKIFNLPDNFDEKAYEVQLNFTRRLMDRRKYWFVYSYTNDDPADKYGLAHETTPLWCRKLVAPLRRKRRLTVARRKHAASTADAEKTATAGNTSAIGMKSTTTATATKGASETAATATATSSTTTAAPLTAAAAKRQKDAAIEAAMKRLLNQARREYDEHVKSGGKPFTSDDGLADLRNLPKITLEAARTRGAAAAGGPPIARAPVAKRARTETTATVGGGNRSTNRAHQEFVGRQEGPSAAQTARRQFLTDEEYKKCFSAEEKEFTKLYEAKLARSSSKEGSKSSKKKSTGGDDTTQDQGSMMPSKRDFELWREKQKRLRHKRANGELPKLDLRRRAVRALAERDEETGSSWVETSLQKKVGLLFKRRRRLRKKVGRTTPFPTSSYGKSVRKRNGKRGKKSEKAGGTAAATSSAVSSSSAASSANADAKKAAKLKKTNRKKPSSRTEMHKEFERWFKDNYPKEQWAVPHKRNAAARLCRLLTQLKKKSHPRRKGTRGTGDLGRFHCTNLIFTEARCQDAKNRQVTCSIRGDTSLENIAELLMRLKMTPRSTDDHFGPDPLSSNKMSPIVLTFENVAHKHYHTHIGERVSFLTGDLEVERKALRQLQQLHNNPAFADRTYRNGFVHYLHHTNRIRFDAKKFSSTKHRRTPSYFHYAQNPVAPLSHPGRNLVALDIQKVPALSYKQAWYRMNYAAPGNPMAKYTRLLPWCDRCGKPAGKDVPPAVGQLPGCMWLSKNPNANALESLHSSYMYENWLCRNCKPQIANPQVAWKVWEKFDKYDAELKKKRKARDFSSSGQELDQLGAGDADPGVWFGAFEDPDDHSEEGSTGGAGTST